jgi:Ca-activated chloride channel homolog
MVTPATSFAHSHISSDAHASTGARLVTVDGKELPLVGAALSAEARGGLARVVLAQRFVNPHAEPLHVRYQLPLPADGAVSGFSFTIAEERIVGEVDKKHRAKERFEQALASGRTAALLEQSRSSVFQQEVGNIPAGQTVIVEVIVDQPLIWLAEGCWEWRFPTVVGPRYMGAKGRVEDADRMTVNVSKDPLLSRLSLELSISDRVMGPIESPSHALDSRDESGVRRISLRAERDGRLNRDLVVRWPVSELEVGLDLSTARSTRASISSDAFGLLTLVPPSPKAEITPVARDLIVLMDTSGSMDGKPIAQAQRVVLALIDSLGPNDQLELIEFSSSPRRWQKEPAQATKEAKIAAARWVRSLRAGGGTEMHAAVLEAIRPIRKSSQRQVVLITDGYIGFEDQIVEAIVRELPRGSRLHTIGVGSSINRSLTQPAARAGAGIEVIVGLDEDAERAAHRILERTADPIVTELQIDGDAVLEASPVRLPDLFRGAPARLALRLSPKGGTVRVRGRMGSGMFEVTTVAPAIEAGSGSQAVPILFGRERIEDLEAKRRIENTSEIDQEIERLGLAFQIASRMTSWIAVHEKVSVDPEARKRSVLVPQELPEGTSIEGLGLRRSTAAPMMYAPAQGVMADRGEIELEAAQDLSFAEEATGSMLLGGLQEDESDLDSARAPSGSTTRAGMWSPPPAPEPPKPSAITAKPAPRAKLEEGAAFELKKEAAPPKLEKQKSPWMLILFLLLFIAALIMWLVMRRV